MRVVAYDLGWLWQVSAVLLTLDVCHVLGKKSKPAPKPHIIMIVADDLGWDDVSFHGSPQIPTPHIDKLANEGVILNSYYVSPICTPTRASLMTGKHPINLGVQHGTIFGTQPYGLPLDETTTPQYLRELGYRTHGVGKWHLGFFEKEYTPTYRGFETFYGFWNGKEDYWDHSSQEDVWGIDLRNNMRPVRNESNHYGTELFTEVAERIIDTHDKSKPLYLYLAQQAVHSANEHEPLQAPQRLQDKFPHFSSDERQTYAAMVASLDESVGNITKALKRNGLYDNSVIVFTTDNGGAPRGFNWNQGCNYPFKGGKDTFWEGGVRGVGFVHSKLIKKKGRVSYDLIDVTDWLPTFYHLAGGDVTKLQKAIDGMNVWDTISRGVKSPRTEVLHNIDPFRKFAAIRVKQYKLIVNQDAVFRTTWLPRYALKGELDNLTEPDTLPGAVIECGKWDKDRNADCNTDKFPCLFNIAKDPCEYRNLASTHLHKVRDLLIRLIHYQANARPVWFPPRDPSASPAEHDGFWGPWMRSSKADKRLVRKAKKGVQHVTYSRDNVHGNGSGLRFGKKLSTHGLEDREVYDMLHDILRVANEGKKGRMPDNQSSLSNGSLARLYSKMKQKTEVDDLIHKLQIVKKAKVKKENAGQAYRKTDDSQADNIDRKLINSVESKNDQKEKQKRTKVGTILLKGGSINAMQQTETGGLNDKYEIHSGSTSEEADKQNIEVEITTVDSNKQIDNENSEPTQGSADVGSEISGEGSGSHNVDDDSSDDASDDFEEDGDDTFNDDDENEHDGEEMQK